MRSARFQLQSGSLWPAIRKRSEEAIRTGALHSIETKQDYIEERGVRFLVRSVSSLARKEAEKKKAVTPDQPTPPFNPFLPPEPKLTVADISPTHLAILNKFNVIDHHLLIVTREFEHQETLLNLSDFEALWVCMAEFKGLGFYNGGRVAGASQTHKHLQMVPLPLVAGEQELPMSHLLESVPWDRQMLQIPALPFPHVFAPLDMDLSADPLRCAGTTNRLYVKMLACLGIKAVSQNGELRQSAPYNRALQPAAHPALDAAGSEGC
jgi:ATP adenylyltransferase